MTELELLRQVVKKAYDFINSEYYSAKCDALDGHPISREARPLYERLAEAMSINETKE